MAADAIGALEAMARDGAVVCVVGPTASGKTELAVALAERLGGEIVSADSVQIYRVFDVGSGKPTAEEAARAVHHLVDVVGPLDPVDASSYASMAAGAIEDVRRRGKVPVVCGGTFLWVKALVYGLVAAPPASAEVRARHAVIAERDGRPALHALLAKVDAASAARLHPNDRVRVSRALEVHELTGRPMSEWQAEHAFASERLDARFVAVARDPATLTARIEARVRRWLGEGWVDEVERLVQAGYGDARAMGSVGYREVKAHLDGALSRDDLAPSIVRATRVFARRQRTWLNHVDVRWVEI